MPTLRDLQLGFATALFDANQHEVCRHIRSNGLTAARRVQIYRHDVFTKFTEALAAVYPVVQRLVGAAFFEQTAREYIVHHPARCGDVQAFGDQFADFFAALPQVAGLPYLPDVARLEWAYHEVFHAADAPPLDPAALAELPPETHGDLRFTLHPAARLLRSNYPVLRIWQVNQSEADPAEVVRLDEGGVRLLVIRRGLDIEFETLSAGAFALLDALAHGGTLAFACEWAIAAQPDLSLVPCLSGHIQRATLVGFRLDSTVS